MNEVFLIDTAIAKLDFVPKYNKSIKINNKIYVRCHSYFINIYNNIPITTPDNITTTPTNATSTVTEPISTNTTTTEPISTTTTVTEPTPTATTVTEPIPNNTSTTVTEPTPNNTSTTVTEPTPTATTVTETTPTTTTVTEPTSTTTAEPTPTTVTEPTLNTTVAEPILNTTVTEPVLNTTVAEPILNTTNTAIIDIDEEIKIKAIKYIQPKIYIDNNYNPISEKFNDIIDNKNSNLYICITHADIIIDLDKKNYKIYKVNFNIRKPTEDRYNLFERIINNINTYYFNINYDVMYITYHLSDVINSIYYINNMSIFLTDNINNINIDLIQHTATSISQEIDYKPFIFNEVKLKIVDINF
jgi:hypothetical protein